MENKKVGYLLIGVAALFVLVILLFNSALKDIANNSCSMGITCPMYSGIQKQTYLALGLVGVIILTGFILIYSKPDEKVIVKRIFEKKRINVDTSDLRDEEKNVLELIKNNNAIFQAELIEKTGFGKAKITRILDRLEGKGIVERKRRGMTNVVVIKN